MNTSAEQYRKERNKIKLWVMCNCGEYVMKNCIKKHYNTNKHKNNLGDDEDGYFIDLEKKREFDAKVYNLKVLYGRLHSDD